MIFKIPCYKILWIDIILRMYEFELVTTLDDDVCIRFWADADPVYTIGRFERSIGLYGDTKFFLMDRLRECFVHLQQGLPTRKYHEPSRLVVTRPKAGYFLSELIRMIRPSIFSIGTPKISVAKFTYRLMSISLQTIP